MKEILTLLVMANFGTKHLAFLLLAKGPSFGFQVLFIGGLLVLVSIIAVVAHAQSVREQRKRLRTAFTEKKQRYLEKKASYDDKVKNAFYGFRTFPVWAVAKCQYATSPLQAYQKGFVPDEDFFAAFEGTEDVKYMKFALDELSRYLVVFSRVLLDFEAIELEIKRVEDTILKSISDLEYKLSAFNDDLILYQGKEYDLEKYHTQYILLNTAFQQLLHSKSLKTVADKEIESSLNDLHACLDEYIKSMDAYIQSKTW